MDEYLTRGEISIPKLIILSEDLDQVMGYFWGQGRNFLSRSVKSLQASTLARFLEKRIFRRNTSFGYAKRQK